MTVALGSTHETSNETPLASRSNRSVALDALRGLTVTLMLLVNNIALGEFTPNQLEHAPWGGGIHLADLVFPWFLFCAGAALPFAWSAARKRNTSRLEWTRKAVTRAVLLFVIGCFITSVVAHMPVFSLGVLQLIAISGLIAAFLEPERPILRILIASILLVAYWLFLRFTPVAGLELGTFEAGRNPAASLNVWLDDFGLRGLPSVVPTAALMLLGSLIGSSSRQLERLGVIGTLLLGLGLLWNLDLEFNKPHWTPAYILFSAGTATLLIAAIGLLERLIGPSWFWSLRVFGSNALLAYVLPILVKIWILQDWRLGKNSLQDTLLKELVDWQGRIIGGWLYTIAYIVIWWLVLLWLYRRELFFRV